MDTSPATPWVNYGYGQRVVAAVTAAWWYAAGTGPALSCFVAGTITGLALAVTVRLHDARAEP